MTFVILGSSDHDSIAIITWVLSLSVMGRDMWHLPMPSDCNQHDRILEPSLDIKKVSVNSFYVQSKCALWCTLMQLNLIKWWRMSDNMHL